MPCYDKSKVEAWAATASALDVCDGSVTVTPTWLDPATDCEIVTVTFTATDDCKNTATSTATFEVKDDQAPVITVPSEVLSMPCYDKSKVEAWAATASALYICDGSVTVTPSCLAPASHCEIVTVTFTA